MITDFSYFPNYSPRKAYSIFCGVIKSVDDVIERISEDQNFKPWQIHEFSDNTVNQLYDENSIIKSNDDIVNLKDYYYDSFVQKVFPQNSNVNKNSVLSFTYPINELLVFNGFEITLKYLDLYLFPKNLMFYCFRIDLNKCKLEDISFLNQEIRNLNTLHNVLLKNISTKLEGLYKGQLLLYGNKLKVYTVIEHDIDFTVEYTQDHLLFDIGTCSPIGSAIGKGKDPTRKPSQDYFTEILAKHKISVFDNWSALSLFDTFSTLHRGSIYNFNWEFRYFRMLYIHSLFIKYSLIEFSDQFHQRNIDKVLEDTFHQFDMHINVKQISYNFLPQIIYDKMRFGFNIDYELNEIKQAISRDTKDRQIRRNQEEKVSDKKINNALLIVAFLGVFTAIFDSSEWLSNVFNYERGLVYNISSVFGFILIVLAMLIIIKRKR